MSVLPNLHLLPFLNTLFTLYYSALFFLYIFVHPLLIPFFYSFSFFFSYLLLLYIICIFMHFKKTNNVSSFSIYFVYYYFWGCVYYQLNHGKLLLIVSQPNRKHMFNHSFIPCKSFPSCSFSLHSVFHKTPS
jgi:hypothetical protein